MTGKQLIALFVLDGWAAQDRRTHGVMLCKDSPSGPRLALIPDKSDDLPPTVLHRILGVKQSGVGRAGLVAMIRRHGTPSGR